MGSVPGNLLRIASLCVRGRHKFHNREDAAVKAANS